MHSCLQLLSLAYRLASWHAHARLPLLILNNPPSHLPPQPSTGRRDEPLAELCARQLAERLCEAGCECPLLLCLALERAALTKAAVQQVVQQVLAHPVW